jgi:hypothetical protein
LQRISISSTSLLAALLLAGAGTASAVSSITRVDHSTFYDRATVQRAFAGGVRTEIYGAPARDASADAIADALALPGGFKQKRFIPLPADAPREGARLVLIFNPRGIFDSDTACSSPGPDAGAGADGPLAVLGVMCQGDHGYARAYMTDGAVTGLGDTFTRSMRQLFLAMFPRQNPELRDRDRDRFP